MGHETMEQKPFINKHENSPKNTCAKANTLKVIRIFLCTSFFYSIVIIYHKHVTVQTILRILYAGKKSVDPFFLHSKRRDLLSQNSFQSFFHLKSDSTQKPVPVE